MEIWRLKYWTDAQTDTQENLYSVNATHCIGHTKLQVFALSTFLAYAAEICCGQRFLMQFKKYTFPD